MAPLSHPVDSRQSRRLGLGAMMAAGLFLGRLLAAEPAGLASRPLNPRSMGSGTTLFTTLPPEQTGITEINHYDDPAMWGAHYREFSLVNRPSKSPT